MSSVQNSFTILAVDDSTVIQTSIKQALAKDYRVLVASQAVAALSMIYHEHIDLLLLDVSMPGMDGLELCRIVRTLPQFHTLPIVMLTSKAEMFDRVQGRLAGATEYLTKPFDAQTLQETVSSLLATHQAGSVK